MELRNWNYRSEEPINKNISFELSALVNADSFVFGVFDHARDLKLADAKSWSELMDTDLDQLVSDVKIRKTKLGVMNSLFSIVPESEFKLSHSSIFLGHVCDLMDAEHHMIRNDYSERFQLRVIYAVEKDVIKKVQESLVSPSLSHFVYACIDSMPDTSQQAVRVVKIGDQAVILVTQGDRLILANQYTIHTDSDILYYLSLIFERLGLDREQQPVEIVGEVEKTGSLYSLLSQYYGELMIPAEPQLISTATIADHVYHPLYYISKCA